MPWRTPRSVASTCTGSSRSDPGGAAAASGARTRWSCSRCGDAGHAYIGGAGSPAGRADHGGRPCTPGPRPSHAVGTRWLKSFVALDELLGRLEGPLVAAGDYNATLGHRPAAPTDRAHRPARRPHRRRTRPGPQLAADARHPGAQPDRPGAAQRRGGGGVDHRTADAGQRPPRRDRRPGGQPFAAGTSCSRVSTSAKRSPCSSTRARTSAAVKTSSDSPSAPASTSSHVTGVDTVGWGRARSE